MSNIKNINELVNALNKGSKLLADMFDKRKTVSLDMDTALEILDDKEELLKLLLRKGIIEEVDNHLEITDPFMRFFEEVLDANEIINVAMVQELISDIKLKIASCMAEETPSGRQKYLRDLRQTFRNIASITRRNIADLRRNAENTYKQEPNYKIKKLHLERLDERREQITAMIRETEKVIESEDNFMNTIADGALRQTVGIVKRDLHDSTHSIIEIQRLIIDYLNRIEYQSRIVKKVRALKYLKDQVMIESQTDILEVLSNTNPMMFKPWARPDMEVSLEFLRNDDSALDLLSRVRRQIDRRHTISERLSPPLSPGDLIMKEEQQRAFDHYGLMNSFSAQGKDLFSFIWQYDFRQPTGREERLVLFLQMASQFSDRLDITDEYVDMDNLTYPIIHLKSE